MVLQASRGGAKKQSENKQKREEGRSEQTQRWVWYCVFLNIFPSQKSLHSPQRQPVQLTLCSYRLSIADSTVYTTRNVQHCGMAHCAGETDMEKATQRATGNVTRRTKCKRFYDVPRICSDH